MLLKIMAKSLTKNYSKSYYELMGAFKDSYFLF